MRTAVHPSQLFFFSHFQRGNDRGRQKQQITKKKKI